MVFWSIEGGWGEERSDLRAGIVASTIANVNRGKSQRAFQPSDFMPKVSDDEPDAEEDGMAPDRIMAVMDGFVARQERREQIERKKRAG